jgi:hypothetical protein
VIVASRLPAVIAKPPAAPSAPSPTCHWARTARTAKPTSRFFGATGSKTGPCAARLCFLSPGLRRVSWPASSLGGHRPPQHFGPPPPMVCWGLSWLIMGARFTGRHPPLPPGSEIGRKMKPDLFWPIGACESRPFCSGGSGGRRTPEMGLVVVPGTMWVWGPWWWRPAV